jgi:hypothetical protein
MAATTANGAPVAVSENNPMGVVRIREQAPKTLEERVARAEAKLAIVDLIARYAAGDRSASVTDDPVFAEDVDYILDGTIEMRVKGLAAQREYHAANQMKGYIRKADGKRAWRGFGDTKFRHLMALPVMRVSADGQTAWVTMHFSGIITRFTAVHSDRTTHEGTYILTLGKTDSGWTIKKFVNLTELAHDPLYHTVDS